MSDCVVKRLEGSLSDLADGASTLLPVNTSLHVYAKVAVSKDGVNSKFTVACDSAAADEDSDSDDSTSGILGQDNAEVRVKSCLDRFRVAKTTPGSYEMLSAIIEDQPIDIVGQALDKRARTLLGGGVLGTANASNIHIGITNWIQALDDATLRFRCAQLAAVILGAGENGTTPPAAPCEECRADGSGCPRGCKMSIWRAVLSVSEPDPVAYFKGSQGRYASPQQPDREDDSGSDTGSDDWDVNDVGLINELESLTKRTATDDSTSTYSYDSRDVGQYGNTGHDAGRSRGSSTNRQLDLLLSHKLLNSKSSQDLFSGLRRKSSLPHLVEEFGAMGRGVFVEPGSTRRSSLPSALEPEFNQEEEGCSLHRILEGTETYQSYHGRPFDEYYWSQEFARLQAIKPLTRADQQAKLRALSQLGSNFIRASEMYGRVIASERNLPVKQKALKPANLGGVAGGEKFSAGGIIFKFAVDSDGLYGSEDLAGKGALHDLKGLDALHSVVFGQGHSLRLPLMTVLEYKGVVIVAVSSLPIHKRTIVYGSSDGGHTVHASDPDVNTMMAQMGSALNLKPHTVGGKTMALCGDLEVHRAADGYVYALDFARIFPPQPPSRSRESTGSMNSIFHNLLRPELVRENKVPLCSDAFSMWDESMDKVVSCSDAKVAYKNMVLRHVPAVAREIEGTYWWIAFRFFVYKGAGAGDPASDAATPLHLSPILHHQGVNMRMLGLILMCVRNSYWRSIVLTEICARSVKTLLKKLLRQASSEFKGIPSDNPYRLLVLELLNQTFAEGGHSEAGLRLWGCIRKMAVEKFGVHGIPDELRDGLHWGRMFVRIVDMMNIGIVHGTLESIASQASPFVASVFLSDSDVLNLGVRTHNMMVVNVGISIESYIQAKAASGQTRLAYLETSVAAFNTYGIRSGKMHMESFVRMELAIEIMKAAAQKRTLGMRNSQMSAEAANKEIKTTIIRAHRLIDTAVSLFTDCFGDQVIPQDRCYQPRELSEVIAIWEEWGVLLMQVGTVLPSVLPHGDLYMGMIPGGDLHYLTAAKKVFAKVACAKGRPDQEKVKRLTHLWNQHMSLPSRIQAHPAVVFHGVHSDTVSGLTATCSRVHGDQYGNVIVSCGLDGYIAVWDSSNGEVLARADARCEVSGILVPLLCVAFAPPHVYVGSCSGNIYSYHLEIKARERTLNGDSVDDITRLSRTAALLPVKVWRAHGLAAVRCLTIVPTLNALVSGGNDCVARVWDTGTLECTHVLEGHSGWVLDVYCDTSRSMNILYTASVDSTVFMWNMSHGFSLDRVMQHAETVHSMCLCEDGCCLYTTAGQDIWRWDTKTQKRENILRGHSDRVHTVTCFKGLLYSGGEDGKWMLWKQCSEDRVDILDFKHSSSRACALDGRCIYGAGPAGLLYGWDVQTVMMMSSLVVSNDVRELKKNEPYYRILFTENFIVCTYVGGLDVFSSRTFSHWGGKSFGLWLHQLAYCGKDVVFIYGMDERPIYMLDLCSMEIQETYSNEGHPSWQGHARASISIGSELFVASKTGPPFLLYKYETSGSLWTTKVLELPITERPRDMVKLTSGLFIGGAKVVLQFDLTSETISRVIDVGQTVYCISAQTSAGFRERLYAGTEQGLVEIDADSGACFHFESVKADTIHSITAAGEFVYTSSDTRYLRRWCPISKKCVGEVGETAVAIWMDSTRSMLGISRGTYPGSLFSILFPTQVAASIYTFRSRFWDGEEIQIPEENKRMAHKQFYRLGFERLNASMMARPRLLLGTFSTMHEKNIGRAWSVAGRILSFFSQLYETHLWKKPLNMVLPGDVMQPILLHLKLVFQTEEKMFLVGMRYLDHVATSEGEGDEDLNPLFEIPVSSIVKYRISSFYDENLNPAKVSLTSGQGGLGVIYKTRHAIKSHVNGEPHSNNGESTISGGGPQGSGWDPQYYGALNLHMGAEYNLVQYWMSVFSNFKDISACIDQWRDPAKNVLRAEPTVVPAGELQNE